MQASLSRSIFRCVGWRVYIFLYKASSTLTEALILSKVIDTNTGSWLNSKMAQYEQFFKDADKDRSGFLTLDELSVILKKNGYSEEKIKVLIMTTSPVIVYL